MPIIFIRHPLIPCEMKSTPDKTHKGCDRSERVSKIKKVDSSVQHSQPLIGHPAKQLDIAWFSIPLYACYRVLDPMLGHFSCR
jgi:hypothetical protein